MSLRFKLHQLAKMAGDPRYLPFFLQRRVKRPYLRDFWGNRLATRRPEKAWTAHLDQSAADRLAANGIQHLGALFTPEQVLEIRWHLEHCKVTDPYQPGSDAFLPLCDHRPDGVHVAYHEAPDVLAAPHLLALANRPEILAIAEAFLGCKPTLGYLASWWSFAAGEGAQAAEKFHRDVDDWKFLKLFVYLTDVGEKQGPHIYVQASGGAGTLDAIRRFDDEEVEAVFGKDAILVNMGTAGDGFIENTYGLHKGQPVEEGYRLIFQAVYSLMPLPYAPRKPVGSLMEARTATGIDLDPYVNRLYLDVDR